MIAARSNCIEPSGPVVGDATLGNERVEVKFRD
jgi:hypothetical protein